MKQALTIPGHLPTLNETINDCKWHWALYYAKKKQYTTLISHLAVLHRYARTMVRVGVIMSYCKMWAALAEKLAQK